MMSNKPDRIVIAKSYALEKVSSAQEPQTPCRRAQVHVRQVSRLAGVFAVVTNNGTELRSLSRLMRSRSGSNRCPSRFEGGNRPRFFVSTDEALIIYGVAGSTRVRGNVGVPRELEVALQSPLCKQVRVILDRVCAACKEGREGRGGRGRLY